MSEQTKTNPELRTPQDYATAIERMGLSDKTRVMQGFGRKVEDIFVAFSKASAEPLGGIAFSFGKDAASGAITVSPDMDEHPYKAQFTLFDSRKGLSPTFKDTPPVMTTLLTQRSKPLTKAQPSMQVAFSENGFTRTQGFGLKGTRSANTFKEVYSITTGADGPAIDKPLSARNLVAKTDMVDLGFMGMISDAEVPLFLPANLMDQPNEGLGGEV